MGGRDGLARAFWAATPDDPDEDLAAQLIFQVLTALSELDSEAYSGAWYRPKRAPNPVTLSEITLTVDGIRDYLLERADKDWRQKRSELSFYAWRTASDGTVVSAYFALGVTSRFLKNSVVVGLSESTTGNAALRRRIVERLWDICRPDVADALDGARNEVFTLGT